MRNLYIALFLQISSLFFSQNYKPIDTMQAAYISSLTGKFEIEKKQTLDNLENNKMYSGKEKKILKEIYTDFYDDEFRETKKGYFFLYLHLMSIFYKL